MQYTINQLFFLRNIETERLYFCLVLAVKSCYTYNKQISDIFFNFVNLLYISYQLFNFTA